MGKKVMAKPNNAGSARQCPGCKRLLPVLEFKLKPEDKDKDMVTRREDCKDCMEKRMAAEKIRIDALRISYFAKKREER